MGYFSIRVAILWILCLWHLSFLDSMLIILVILWVMSLSHLPFCGFYVCRTEFYGFHSCHTCWFVGSVSITHNCMGSMYITLVGLWVLCPSHIIVWIPSLSCWVCGFCVSQHFAGFIFWSYNCMVSMPFTLAALWVLCLSNIIAWVWCLSCLLVCGFCVLELLFSGILPFCGFCIFCTYHFVGSIPLSIRCYFRLCPLVRCNLLHICLWPSSFLFSFIRDVGIPSDSYYSHGILT